VPDPPPIGVVVIPLPAKPPVVPVDDPDEDPPYKLAI
jgi:hypothetical protein